MVLSRLEKGEQFIRIRTRSDGLEAWMMTGIVGQWGQRTNGLRVNVWDASGRRKKQLSRFMDSRRDRGTICGYTRKLATYYFKDTCPTEQDLAFGIVMAPQAAIPKPTVLSQDHQKIQNYGTKQLTAFALAYDTRYDLAFLRRHDQFRHGPWSMRGANAHSNDLERVRCSNCSVYTAMPVIADQMGPSALSKWNEMANHNHVLKI
ncbi:hypothetical protein BV22DRAFT_1117479 [Leucogyrophana mollusca]|uniref:Uncharacterized protein n=1 Tax=Leucogyrophana mollusca TaxID=85980 RepID=A0ACB8BSL2_9AGAM|nr:hypothetical protein BV22DRAFT_1117479 [Leucogyrophana mollusca]